MDVKRILDLPSWITCSETQILKSVFEDKKSEIRFVGGCVRDFLLGRQVHDLDLATSLLPNQIIERLKSRHLKPLLYGVKHGSIAVSIAPYHFEITTLRQDNETDGRYAKVNYISNWSQDAERRDFTFNALYLSFQGELYDYKEGEQDLKQRKVCFIGDPSQRIQEDYLRILRYFRFHALYGDNHFKNKEALQACYKYKDKLILLSSERITKEILKLLSALNPVDALKKMIEYEIWEEIGSKITFDDLNHLEKLVKIEQEFQISPCPYRRLVCLYKSKDLSLKKMIAALKISNAEKNYMGQLIKASKMMCRTSKELLYDYGFQLTQSALCLQVARGYNHWLLETLSSDWKRPQFPLSGNDLITMGVKAGILLGKTLYHTKQWWIKNEFKADYNECLKEALKYYQSLISS